MSYLETPWAKDTEKIKILSVFARLTRRPLSSGPLWRRMGLFSALTSLLPCVPNLSLSLLSLSLSVLLPFHPNFAQSPL